MTASPVNVAPHTQAEIDRSNVYRAACLSLHSSHDCQVLEAAVVSLGEDDGAYVAARLWISENSIQERASKGDYKSYAIDHLQVEGETEFDESPAIEVVDGGAWVQGWLWVTDDEALSYLWLEIPQKDRVSSLDHLAEDIFKAGFDNSAIDGILNAGGFNIGDFQYLFSETDLDIGVFNTMLQSAVARTQQGIYCRSIPTQ